MLIFVIKPLKCKTMKRLILSLLLVGLTGFFFSCAKKTPAPNNSPSNSMTASISGTAWTAKTLSPVANAVVITVTGTASDGSSMKMTMPPTVKAGTYSFSESGDYTFQYSNTVTNFIVNSGSSSTLTISSYSNNVMKGTFQASVTGGGVTKTITSGSFTAIFP